MDDLTLATIVIAAATALGLIPQGIIAVCVLLGLSDMKRTNATRAAQAAEDSKTTQAMLASLERQGASLERQSASLEASTAALAASLERQGAALEASTAALAASLERQGTALETLIARTAPVPVGPAE